MRKAVFFDRDGVLNRVVMREGKVASPRSLGEFVLETGAVEAAERLKGAGYLLFVVSNQPDVARGLLDRAVLDAISEAIRGALPIDEVRVCPHDDADGCGCRKPKPGLLTGLAERWGVDLGASYMIGDQWRDVEAGCAAGCQTVLLRRPYNEGVAADFVAETLGAAADLILMRRMDDV